MYMYNFMWLRNHEVKGQVVSYQKVIKFTPKGWFMLNTNANMTVGMHEMDRRRGLI